MFTYRDFGRKFRYGEVQFTDPTTGKQFTVYIDWDEVSPILKEVK